MPPGNTKDALTIALDAIAWTLADDDRATRLIALTGIAPDALRGRLGEPAVLAAALTFLEANERDLIACAAATGHPPESLVTARCALEAA